MEIQGKRVMITGASRGLGRALALACERAGAREVIAGVRDPEAVRGLGPAITPVRLDVTSDEDVAASVASVGRVDVLINNAGVNAWTGLLTGEVESMRHEVEVNYFGVLRMVRAVAPAMIEHRDGIIVNVSSILGKVSMPLVGSYSATKAAVLSLSQALRGELEHRGVRVITVLPGAIDTDMNRNYDGPKSPPAEIAAGILEAIRNEKTESAIGADATTIMASLTASPLEVERMFAQFRSQI